MAHFYYLITNRKDKEENCAKKMRYFITYIQLKSTWFIPFYPRKSSKVIVLATKVVILKDIFVFLGGTASHYMEAVTRSEKCLK